MVIENGLNFCLDYLIRAEEVKASMNIKRSLEQMLLRKSHQVNLSTVRSKYRFSRKKARYVHFQIWNAAVPAHSWHRHVGRDGRLDTQTLYDRAWLYCNDYLRAIKRIIYAKNTIVLFVSYGVINKQFRKHPTSNTDGLFLGISRFNCRRLVLLGLSRGAESGKGCWSLPTMAVQI
jgi:hypothetical protein